MRRSALGQATWSLCLALQVLILPTWMPQAASGRSIQDPEDVIQPAESFDERISVMEVMVPVRVRLGREPVIGLTAENFEVYDRGVLQEIVSFTMTDLRSTEGLTALDLSGLDTAIAPAQNPAEGRSLVLLFDFAFSNHFSVLRALEGAREMVASQLHPHDRVAIAYFSAFNGIHFIVDFTRQTDQLAVALDVIEGVLARNPERIREHQLSLATLQGGDPAPKLPPEPLDFDKQAAQSIMLAYIAELSESLTQMVTELDEVPGTRHLLFFSEGFGSLSPASSMGTSILAELEPMRQTFLHTGWMLHSIDLKGIPVSYAKFSNNALFYLANETGGELLANYNKFDHATERFLEGSSVTYVITYQARNLPSDRKFHKIEVKLAGGPEKARLNHRPGYYTQVR